MDELKVNPHVVLQSMGEGSLLMNTESADCFELNRVGRDVWIELELGKTIPEIADVIVNRYAVDHVTAVADVTLLIAALTGHGILVRKSAT